MPNLKLCNFKLCEIGLGGPTLGKADNLFAIAGENYGCQSHVTATHWNGSIFCTFLLFGNYRNAPTDKGKA